MEAKGVVAAKGVERSLAVGRAGGEKANSAGSVAKVSNPEGPVTLSTVPSNEMLTLTGNESFCERLDVSHWTIGDTPSSSPMEERCSLRLAWVGGRMFAPTESVTVQTNIGRRGANTLNSTHGASVPNPPQCVAYAQKFNIDDAA